MTEIEIKSQLQEVVEFAINPDNVQKWYQNIKYSKRLPEGTEDPLKVGSLIEFKAEFLGKKMSYTYKVNEWTPTRFVMSTEQGPFPMETTYEWFKLDEHTTRMTLRNTGYPVGFSKLLAPIMSLMIRRANNRDLKLLKSILESQSPMN